MTTTNSFTIRRDRGLMARVMFTMFLIGVIYAGFTILLWQLGLHFAFIGIIVGGLALLQYFFSEKIVLAATRAKIVSEKEEPQLHAMIAKLAARVNTPMPRVAIIPSDVPNAFATGRNPKNSLVAVTEGIRRRLSARELEAVLGHEIAHITNRDMRIMAIANFFVTIVGFVSSLLLYSLFFQGMFGGRSSRGEGGNIGLILIAVYVVSIMVHIILQILVLAMTRYREYGADHTGAQISGDPIGLASALAKINVSVAEANGKEKSRLEPANSFLFIPAMGGISGLFSTHPPVQERIRRLEKMAREMSEKPSYERFQWEK